MGIFVLGSASGSRGVTATVMGLALTWPRPVLVVEADPTGGSGILAGFFRGQLEPSGGLLELVMAHRHNLLADTLPRILTAVPDTNVSVLPGIRSHAQAAGLTQVWPTLLEALRELEGTGTDVLVDAGRLGLEGWPKPLLLGADVTALVTGSSLPELAAARSWTTSLREDAAGRGVSLGLVVIGPSRPYGPAEVAKTLGLPVLACIDHDDRAAAVFARGAARPRGFERTAMVRSLRAAGEILRTTAQQGSLHIAEFDGLSRSGGGAR